MSGMAFNLDKLAAELAQTIVEKVKKNHKQKEIDTLERLVTKTMGVMQEQGVYAMLLFLLSRTGDEKKIAPFIRDQIYNALRSLPGFTGNSEIPNSKSDAQAALAFCSKYLLNDLDQLFLLRDLYEQMLIYTRFGAKAEDK